MTNPEHSPRENPGPQDMGTDDGTGATPRENPGPQDGEVDADAGVTPRENPGPQDMDDHPDTGSHGHGAHVKGPSD